MDNKIRRFIVRHRYLAIELIVMSAIGIALEFAAIGELDHMVVNHGTTVNSAARDAEVIQASAVGANASYRAASLNRTNFIRSFPKRGTGMYDGP